MSRTRDLQNFLRDNRKIRPSGESPHDTQEEDKRLSDKEMREANVKAIEEARRKGKSTLTPRQRDMVRTVEEETPQKPKEIPLMEKDAGGGGGDGGGGLAGGGTVAVASDPGVFTSTYGGDSKRRLGMHTPKKKKKKKEKDNLSQIGRAHV